MPILTKPPKTEPRKAVTIRMQQSIVVALHQYARFLGCSLDYVVVEALKLVFNKDAEFQEWMPENAESEGRQPTLKGLQTAEQDSVQPISINPRKHTR